MRSVVAIAICLDAAAVAAAPPTQTVTIEATPVQARVHRGDRVEITLRTVNTTGIRQEFQIMNCSWPESWRSDDPALPAAGAECTKNFQITLALAPGEVDTRTLALSVAPTAAFGAHTLHLGFKPIGAAATIWSGVATLQVVDLGSGLALSSKSVKPREIAFALRNPTGKPLEISDRVGLQHYVNGAWTDMTWISASSCAAPAACTTLAPDKTLVLADWNGMTCMQCGCHANTFAEAGQYRLRVEACDGKTDYVGAPVSLPAP